MSISSKSSFIKLRAVARRAQKGAFLGAAAAQGIALLFPDTSPRGAGIPGEDDDWDFGTGAGFYLNATNPQYAKHYNMLTHITLELPQVLEAAGLPIVCGFGLYLVSHRSGYNSNLKGFYSSEYFRTLHGRAWCLDVVPRL